MKPYEIIEHTADVGLKVSGSNLKELFENAAKGMFSIISGDRFTPKTPHTGLKRKIQIKKEFDSFEELLVAWLSECLYVFNKEELLFRDFNILELDKSGLIGEISGEKVDFSKSMLQTEIKAVTFHNLKIEEDKYGFSCTIIFDV